MITISQHGSDTAANIVKEGDHIDITCTAKSSPRPFIVLTKNGEILHHSSSLQMPLGNQKYKKTITLPHGVKRKDDAGVYTCTVESGKLKETRNKILEIECKFKLLTSIPL